MESNASTSTEPHASGSSVPGVFAVVVLIALAFWLLWPSSASVPAATPQPTVVVNMNDFRRVQVGMTIVDVENLVGKAGELVSSSTSTEMYSWANNDGSNMLVTLQDRSVVSKAQFGLK